MVFISKYGTGKFKLDKEYFYTAQMPNVCNVCIYKNGTEKNYKITSLESWLFWEI